MRRIMILNPKGGCGKSTIATNLAGFYAVRGEQVMLADLDPQRSALDWLELRPDERPEIFGRGIEYDKNGLLLPHTSGTLIFDVPAGLHDKHLKAGLKLAQTVVVPVLPSTIDIRAAGRFLVELHKMGRFNKQWVKVAVVANRVRENNHSFQVLKSFLDQLDIPVITTLHDSQNYVHAAEQGLSIFEFPPSRVERELRQWLPLIKWLDSEQSMPSHLGKKAS